VPRVTLMSLPGRRCRQGGLEPGASSFIRVLYGGLFPQDRSCDQRNDAPLDTVAGLLCAVNSASANSAAGVMHGLPACCVGLREVSAG
jgi:hypothetical protein